SYRLHKDWKKRAKKGASLFQDGDIPFPFLRTKTIRTLSPFEAWYELWPEFEDVSRKVVTEEGFEYLTKTDITAYFENIDLRLLEAHLRDMLPSNEEQIVRVVFRILEGWTRDTSAGVPVGRGIPQGNEISSFLGNIYLV